MTAGLAAGMTAGMAAGTDFGIAAYSLAKLRALFAATPGVARVWVFGSRALGSHRPESDVDLAVEAPGMDASGQMKLANAVQSLGLLYRVDLVFLGDPLAAAFRAQIEAHRRVFWQPAGPITAAPQAVGGVALKPFQERVLEQLGTYLAELNRQRAQTEAQSAALRTMEGAEDTLRALADFPARTWATLRKAGLLPPLLKGQSAVHHSRWDGAGRAIPNVCLKVPTGGGKTLLGAAAVGQILHTWQRRSSGLVLWVVPNEAIYSQTLKALANRDHPYRQLLNVAGAGRVKVLEKTHPLTRQDVEGQLCVMVLMLAGANRRNKETLKFFADSGRVSGFLPREDDQAAHHDLVQKTPNLDVYRSLGQTAEEARAQLGSVVKSSLGNVMRLVRPLVIIDEGHHAYSDGALQTLDGFNPCFMLELSATPRLPVVKKGVTSSGSNVLANVHGTDLDEAEMIKLPIHVDVRGWSDWRTCLAAALQRLDGLQREAEALQGDTARYIRPILLVQVERTGAEHRDSGFIHAEDAREHLLALGLQPRQIAVKTSEKNELNQPENINLLSPTCEVRAIITKQALQEGWDCPFAYVLCALAAGRNMAAMTQLVGRVLRLPQVAKTGRPALDACYVLCHDAQTGQVVSAIKKSLEDEGMGDLGLAVQGGETDPDAPKPVAQRRRSAWRGVRLFLPRVTWVESDGTRRALEYESDVLQGLDWSGVQPADWVAAWAPDQRPQAGTTLALGLELLQGGTAQLPQAAGDQPLSLDRGRVVRALADLVPSPWLAWSWLAAVVAGLEQRGLAEAAVAASALSLIETLRAAIEAERDRLAEAHFAALLAQGRIEFCLRADQANYELPADFELLAGGAPQPWLDASGLQPMKRTLYEPALRTADINEFEHKVAGWLDDQQAVRWWHRNVARTQLGLQGWRRHKVYPDFIFAMDTAHGARRMVLLETKGLHLENKDTDYKRALLNKLSGAFRDERWAKVGSLDLVGGAAEEVACELVFDQGWQGQLNTNQLRR